MGTRSIIEIRDGYNRYGIYRHYDGYPDAILGDIRRVMEVCPLDDAEYFLANFIFLAKWNLWRCGFDWSQDYGVCSPTCEHGDVEYKYEIWYNNGWMIKIRRCMLDEDETEVTIFKGKLEEAFERFIGKFELGCHIRELPKPKKR